jgi:hypothetical protein
MLAASSATLLLTLADRTLALGLNLWWTAALPLGLGIFVSIASLFRSSSSDLRATALVDHALGQRDRLTNGVALSSDDTDAFVALAHHEANRASARIDVRAAVPFSFGNSWRVWPVIAALAVVLGLYLPQYDLLRRRQHITSREQARAQAASIKQEIAAATQFVPPQDDEAPRAQTEIERRHIDELKQIEAELASGKVDTQTAADRAAAALERAASARQAAAERSLAVQQAVEREFSKLPASKPQESALSKAVRSGDLAEAAAAARELASASDAERQEMAQELARLAQDLDQLANTPESDSFSSTRSNEATTEPRPEITNAPLTGSDLSPDQARELLEHASPEELQQELERRGVDPDNARRLAEQNQIRRDTEQAKTAARDATSALSKALKKAAEALQKHEPPQTPASPTQQESSSAQSTSGSQADTSDSAKSAPKSPAPDTNKPNQVHAVKSNNQQSPDDRATSEQQRASDRSMNPSQDRPSSPNDQAASERPTDAPKQPEHPNAQRTSIEPNRSASTSPPSQPADARRSTSSSQDQPKSTSQDSKSPSGQPDARQQSGAEKQGSKDNHEQGSRPDANGEQHATEPGDKQRPSNQPNADQSVEQSQQASRPDKPTGSQTDAKPGEEPASSPRPMSGQPQTETLQPGTEDSKSNPQPASSSASRPNATAPSNSSSPQPRSSANSHSPQSQQSGQALSTAESKARSSSSSDQSSSEPRSGGQADPETSPKTLSANDNPTTNARQSAPSPSPDNTDRSESAPDPSANEAPLENLARELEKAGGNKSRAQRDAQQARDLRERAKRLLDRMTPEQRRDLEQWARNQPQPDAKAQSPDALSPDSLSPNSDLAQRSNSSGKSSTDHAANAPLAHPGGSPRAAPSQSLNRAQDHDQSSESYRTKLLDARPPTPEERAARSRDSVMAEWLSPGDSRTGTQSQSPDDVLQKAQRGAERAIEERTVPSRFDRLLNAYFRRLPEAVKQSPTASAEPAAPAPPAPDAK